MSLLIRAGWHPPKEEDEEDEEDVCCFDLRCGGGRGGGRDLEFVGPVKA